MQLVPLLPAIALLALAVSSPAQSPVFFTGKQLVPVGTGNAWAPTMNETETEIVFSSNRSGGSGGWDLWTASRASADVPFGAPTNLSALNSATSDYEANMSRDGRELYFISTRTGGPGGANVMVSKRIAPGLPWQTPTFLGAPVNGAGLGNDDPALSDDMLTMYFSRGGDILTVTRTSTSSAWGSQGSFAAANVKGATEHSPTPYANGNMMVFASTASGSTGSSDFHFVWRNSVTNVWSKPIELKALNLTGWDSNAFWGRATGRIYWSDWNGAGGPRIQCSCYRMTSMQPLFNKTTRLVPFTRSYWPAPSAFAKRSDWKLGGTYTLQLYDWRKVNQWILAISPFQGTGITIPGIMDGGIEVDSAAMLVIYLPNNQLTLRVPTGVPKGVVYMQGFGIDATANKIYTSDLIEADLK